MNTSAQTYGGKPKSEIEETLRAIPEAMLFREVKRRAMVDKLEQLVDWQEYFATEPDESLALPDDISEDRLEEARCRLQRGEQQECLHQLSIALGPDFARLDDIVVAGGTR